MNKSFLILLTTAIVTASVFMPPVCNLLFKCGCSYLWTTAAQHCNVHHSLPPHCPWCSHGNVGYYVPFFGFILGQFLAGFLILRLTGNLLLAASATVFSMLVVGLLMGYITILLVDYPHFVF